jgi:hypothetical protein
MGILSEIKRRYRESEVKAISRETYRLDKRLTSALSGFGIEQGGSEAERYFSVLGIKPTGNKRAIRDAYLKQIKKYHPDINDDPGATEKTKMINQAYSMLTGSGLRYDVKETGEISEKLALSIKRELLKAYEARRKKEYEALLTSAGYNRNNWDIVRADIKKFADWRTSYRYVCKEQFGVIFASEKRIMKLNSRAEALLDRLGDEHLGSQLRGSIDRLAAMKAVSGSVSESLNSIIKEVEKELAKTEDRNSVSW